MISSEFAVEVISPTGALSCTLSPLPLGQTGHTHNKNIICGGYNKEDEFEENEYQYAEYIEESDEFGTIYINLNEGTLVN